MTYRLGGYTDGEGTDVTTWIWVDGRVEVAGRAAVPADDRGLLSGAGVFETVSVRDGIPFMLDRHLDRLRASGKIAAIGVPWSDVELNAACSETIAAAQADPTTSRNGWLRLRLTITGGSGTGGPRLLVAVSPDEPRPAITSVVTSPWPVNEMGPLVGAKVTSRHDYTLALADAHARGADEAVLVNSHGMLVEASTANVFLVVAGRLSTPSLATGCLPGVTRSLVMEGVVVNERDDLTIDDLRLSTEAFLTSTTRGVQPITSVDGTPLRSAPGPLTSAAHIALESLRPQ